MKILKYILFILLAIIWLPVFIPCSIIGYLLLLCMMAYDKTRNKIIKNILLVFMVIFGIPTAIVVVSYILLVNFYETLKNS